MDFYKNFFFTKLLLNSCWFYGKATLVGLFNAEVSPSLQAIITIIIVAIIIIQERKRA